MIYNNNNNNNCYARGGLEGASWPKQTRPWAWRRRQTYRHTNIQAGGRLLIRKVINIVIIMA